MPVGQWSTVQRQCPIVRETASVLHNRPCCLPAEPIFIAFAFRYRAQITLPYSIVVRHSRQMEFISTAYATVAWHIVHGWRSILARCISFSTEKQHKEHHQSCLHTLFKTHYRENQFLSEFSLLHQPTNQWSQQNSIPPTMIHKYSLRVWSYVLKPINNQPLLLCQRL